MARGRRPLGRADRPARLLPFRPVRGVLIEVGRPLGREAPLDVALLPGGTAETNPRSEAARRVLVEIGLGAGLAAVLLPCLPPGPAAVGAASPLARASDRRDRDALGGGDEEVLTQQVNLGVRLRRAARARSRGSDRGRAFAASRTSRSRRRSVWRASALKGSLRWASGSPARSAAGAGSAGPGVLGGGAFAGGGTPARSPTRRPSRRLTAIKGVGRWTAEIALLRGLWKVERVPGWGPRSGQVPGRGSCG